jgi:hypothetical protein
LNTENQHELEQFLEVLRKKYIVQLGFHNLFKGVQKIGQGSTAPVYKTRCLSTGKIVAVKSFSRVKHFAS